MGEDGIKTVNLDKVEAAWYPDTAKAPAPVASPTVAVKEKKKRAPYKRKTCNDLFEYPPSNTIRRRWGKGKCLDEREMLIDLHFNEHPNDPRNVMPEMFESLVPNIKPGKKKAPAERVKRPSKPRAKKPCDKLTPIGLKRRWGKNECLELKPAGGQPAPAERKRRSPNPRAKKPCEDLTLSGLKRRWAQNDCMEQRDFLADRVGDDHPWVQLPRSRARKPRDPVSHAVKLADYAERTGYLHANTALPASLAALRAWMKDNGMARIPAKCPKTAFALKKRWGLTPAQCKGTTPVKVTRKKREKKPATEILFDEEGDEFAHDEVIEPGEEEEEAGDFAPPRAVQKNWSGLTAAFKRKYRMGRDKNGPYLTFELLKKKPNKFTNLQWLWVGVQQGKYRRELARQRAAAREKLLGPSELPKVELQEWKRYRVGRGPGRRSKDAPVVADVGDFIDNEPMTIVEKTVLKEQGRGWGRGLYELDRVAHPPEKGKGKAASSKPPSKRIAPIPIAAFKGNL
eukprot:jgi/Mesvir1/18576/Mv17085-RA.1